VVAAAAAQVRRETGIRLLLVLPEERLRPIAESLLAPFPEIEVQIGQLSAALLSATVAMASTGTVTLECAWFGVPTVALYKTWFLTYQVGKRIITVRHLAMPNLLAGETVLPEFVQDDATASHLAAATLALLQDNSRRLAIRRRLLELAQSLGQPGTSQRAADAIARLLSQAGRAP
jgi:lipid-A-disaccharide synthase